MTGQSSLWSRDGVIVGLTKHLTGKQCIGPHLKIYNIHPSARVMVRVRVRSIPSPNIFRTVRCIVGPIIVSHSTCALHETVPYPQMENSEQRTNLLLTG